ncbi:MAG TPA: VOC family protein [Caulobacteraceae bacterium]|nr:VOC family protein [Caulobacteraceae bacterium]
MSKITPFLWFDGQAEEAVSFYLSVFKGAKAGAVSRYGDAGPGPKGQVMVASFELDGITFSCLNGGPQYRFTEAVSFMVNCKDQDEVDDLWAKLTADGGQPGPCGWLKDKFGLSWQIVPEALPRLIGDPDPARAKRATEAMLKMGKLDIAALEAAAAG